jgi:hypothetical protein
MGNGVTNADSLESVKFRISTDEHFSDHLNLFAINTPIGHKPLADTNAEAERLIALSRAGQDISREYNAMPVNEQGAVGSLMKSRSQQEESQVPYLNKLTVETNQDGTLAALHVHGLTYDSGRQSELESEVYKTPSAEADKWLAKSGNPVPGNDKQRLADSVATILPKLGDKHLEVSPEALKAAYVTGKYPDGSIIPESDREALQDVLQNFRDISTHPAGSRMVRNYDFTLDEHKSSFDEMPRRGLGLDENPRLGLGSDRNGHQYGQNAQEGIPTYQPLFQRSLAIGAYELSVLQGTPDTKYVRDNK